MPRKQWIEYTAVRGALAFPTVLSHYDIDHPTGQTQFKVHCPFHDDRTPSCSINAEKGIFKCFGCDMQGNVLEFVVAMEGGTPGDKDDMHEGAQKAIEIMGRRREEFGKPGAAARRTRAASAVPAEEDTPRPRAKAKSRKPPASNTAAEDDAPPAENPVLELALDVDPEHPFLVTRGIDRKTAERWGIGFCNRGIMKGRIAIPIHNSGGDLVAYVGRHAAEDVPEGLLRYKFPKTFHKSLVLFNLHRARQLEKRFVVVVEGIWSVIRLHDLGIPVVGLLGTSCSPRQAELVAAAGFRYVTLMLDGDDAGHKAAPAAAHELAKVAYVHTVELPTGEKPDTVSEHFLKRYL